MNDLDKQEKVLRARVPRAQRIIDPDRSLTWLEKHIRISWPYFVMLFMVISIGYALGYRVVSNDVVMRSQAAEAVLPDISRWSTQELRVRLKIRVKGIEMVDALLSPDGDPSAIQKLTTWLGIADEPNDEVARLRILLSLIDRWAALSSEDLKYRVGALVALADGAADAERLRMIDRWGRLPPAIIAAFTDGGEAEFAKRLEIVEFLYRSRKNAETLSERLFQLNEEVQRWRDSIIKDVSLRERQLIELKRRSRNVPLCTDQYVSCLSK